MTVIIKKLLLILGPPAFVWAFFTYQNWLTYRALWQCPECELYSHRHEPWCSIGRCWAPDWWITR